MKEMEALCLEITSKRVCLDSYSNAWFQEEDCIYVPMDDIGGLLHEILHWIVATPEERTWPNLALDEDVAYINPTLPEEEQLVGWTPDTPEARERACCVLERRIYALRGRSPPADSSCRIYTPLEEDEEWAEDAIRAFPNILLRLAAAL